MKILSQVLVGLSILVSQNFSNRLKTIIMIKYSKFLTIISKKVLCFHFNIKS